MGRSKVHTRYKLANGDRVVGVTTVTGELGWNKNQLVRWANKLGLKGIDSTKYKDDKADIGTIAHGLILEYHGGEKFDRKDYSENQLNEAQNSFNSYLAWVKGKTLKPILLEKLLLSEMFKFGGTPDNYCELDGVKTLIDYKTGKGIYPEYFIQVGGGYRQLLLENGYKVDKVIILNVPRTEDESFQVKEITKVDLCWEIFHRALQIHYLKKGLEQ